MIAEECGAVALAGARGGALEPCLKALECLQHRGQDAFGVCVFDGEEMRCDKRLGAVTGGLDLPSGQSALGHVRYATSDAHGLTHAQPVHSPTSAFGPLSLAHNGHLSNAHTFAPGLGLPEVVSDTKVLLHLVARTKALNFWDALADALGKLEGAYTLVGMTREGIFGLRGPHGVRPLSVGWAPGGGVWLGSEDVAVQAPGMIWEDLAPGELFFCSHDATRTWRRSGFVTPAPVPKRCVFELVYFAHTQSTVFGHQVAQVRQALGALLACHVPLPDEVDLVCGIPQSGLPAAQGFATALGLPLLPLITREPGAGRSFIASTARGRLEVLATKFRIDHDAIQGKHLLLIDDSLVRGTTASHLTARLRQAGALSVHWRIAAPPVIAPCFYGIHTPYSHQLAAHGLDEVGLAAALGADTLAYLPLEQLRSHFGPDAVTFCDACFSARYEVPRG